MKVIVTGARHSGGDGEAHGYALSVEAHDAPDRHSDSILLVHWRMLGNESRQLKQQLATTAVKGLLWYDIEPEQLSAVEEVPVGDHASNRYADALYDEAEAALTKALDL